MSIPDKFHRNLQKLIGKANPQTPEELQQFLDSLIGKPLPEMSAEGFSPEDQAFDLMDAAWQSTDAKGRKLAEQALKTWPDCIAAYEYLAAKSNQPKSGLDFIKKALKSGNGCSEVNFWKKTGAIFG